MSTLVKVKHAVNPIISSLRTQINHFNYRNAFKTQNFSCTSRFSWARICSHRTYASKAKAKGETFVADKPHCNMGTIGHIDHGKTTLTAAITKVMEKQGRSKFMRYEDIDKAPLEQARGITINACHVEYSTEKRHYAHTDCPGHIDFIKNMIAGTSQMDGAVVVVAADDGTMPQTREHILLARQIGVQKVVVFINKADLVDDDMLELVKLEVLELLEEFGYDPDDTPVIYGSALCALKDTKPEIGEEAIHRLMEAIDEHIPTPNRDMDGPFIVPIDKIASITGRGTVAIGTIQRGEINMGDPVQLIGFGVDMKSTITDMEVFHKQATRAKAGDNVGILLRGVKRDYVQRGMLLCKPGTVQQTDSFRAQLYIRTRQEGGRSKPMTTNYINQIYCDTWDQACCIQLPEDKTMVLPGDHCETEVLLRKPMVIKTGSRFVVRENQMTAVTGLVTEILPNTTQKLKGFNWEPPKPAKIQTNSRSALAKRRKK